MDAQLKSISRLETADLVKRKSLAQKLAENLKNQIEVGAFAANHQLPNENQLMKIYGVGRSTVREAVLRLSNSGLVCIKQGKGTYVLSEGRNFQTSLLNSTTSYNSETDEVFGCIQMQVIRNAAANCSKGHCIILRNSIEMMKGISQSTMTWTAFVDAVINFKSILSSICQNRTLSGIYLIFLEQIKFKLLTDPIADIHQIRLCIALHELILVGIHQNRPEIFINPEDFYLNIHL